MESESDIHLALFVIVVICLIVIAMSSYQSAYGSSYMTGQVTDYVSNPSSTVGAANLRFAGESSQQGLKGSSGFIGSGMNEPPVFYNTGSFEDVNNALQTASKQAEGFKVGNSHFVGSADTVSNAKVIKTAVDYTNLEAFAGKGF
jgi:hypothetical protein